MHGVGINNRAYMNKGACGAFINFMAEDIANKLNRELGKAHSFRALWDGTTDKSIPEQEVTFFVLRSETSR